MGTGLWVNLKFFFFALLHFPVFMYHFLNKKETKPHYLSESNKQALIVPSGIPGLSGTVRQSSADQSSFECPLSSRKKSLLF